VLQQPEPAHAARKALTHAMAGLSPARLRQFCLQLESQFAPAAARQSIAFVQPGSLEFPFWSLHTLHAGVLPQA
jgi:hypothetical protein